MNYKFKGYNRLLVVDAVDLPDCRLYNRWAKRILKSGLVGI